MNGIAIPIKADAKTLALGSDALLEFIDQAGRLQEWGEREVRALLEEEPKLKKLRFVSTELWEKSHSPRLERSRDALRRFLEWKVTTE
jgi:hypothetical protein